MATRKDQIAHYFRLADKAKAEYDRMMQEQKDALTAVGWDENDYLHKSLTQTEIDAECQAMDAICDPIIAKYPADLWRKQSEYEDKALALAKLEAVKMAQSARDRSNVNLVFTAAIDRRDLKIRNKTLDLVRSLYVAA